MKHLATIAACSFAALLGLAAQAQTPALYGVRGKVTVVKGDPCQGNQSDKALLACAKSKLEGSPEAMLAYADLGTRATEANNVQLAASYYLHTVPSSHDEIVVDARFHAYRAAAFHSLGRDDEALADVRKALEFVDHGVLDPQGTVLSDARESWLLGTLLPTLVALKAPETDRVAARFMDIPVRDWTVQNDRSAVLAYVGRYDEAVALIDPLLAERPDQPVLNNNKCDYLVKAHRAAEALDYCKAAVAGAPRQAVIVYTYAQALSALGRCPEAVTVRERAMGLAPKLLDMRAKLSCEAP